MTEHAEEELVVASRAAEQAGITYRKFNWWVNKGYIHVIGPRNPGSGYGRERMITDHEARALWWARHLTDQGMHPRGAMPAARSLARGEPARLGALTIIPTPEPRHEGDQ